MRAVVVAVVAAAVLAGAFAANGAVERGLFGDGIYRVGSDIKPGTYRNRGGSATCYWARLKNFSGSLNAIIANDNAVGPAVVTIAKSDRGFETTRCGNWSKDLSRITKSKTRFAAGTYIVGTDIRPGTYRSSRSGNSCYWARLRNFSGTLGGIIANDIPSGRAIVTIGGTDKGFQSVRCGVWTRISG